MECATTQLWLSETAGPADERAKAGEHLFDPEGLRHIVVRPSVDTQDFLMPGSARGQDEDRRAHALFPPTPQQREAIYFRQAEVKHNRVILLAVDQKVSLFAVNGAVHCITTFSQRFGHLPGQKGFVFDDQNPQLDIYTVLR